ncbi:30S ribosomal protein S27e [Candidatus Micrarchaeota archaeon]|nr:30S ribosomal protein S27e [Candidatus Micrarchaeota archaeon]
MANFMLIKCECGNEQVVYERATLRVKCKVCGKVLTESSGGKVIVVGGTVIKEKVE